MTQPTQPIEKLLENINEIQPENFSSDGDRNQALLAAYALIGRLETPWETIARVCMNQPAMAGSLKTCKDLKLFETWHERGDAAETSQDLAVAVGCDPVLLARIIRHLAANHFLQEVSPDTYKLTRFSRALVQPIFGEWINWLFDGCLPSFHKMPQFLQKRGYKSPTDPENGIFQYAKDYKGDLFHYYADHPREGESFNKIMGGVMGYQASWVDIMPTESFLDGADPNLPLVVDVGGGIGHDIEKFRVNFPDTAARLYLQDLPPVIAKSQCLEPLTSMAHDFFQPQPVKDARVYYLHGVIHDWSDEPARKILQMLRGALKPGYSQLLIHDHVVPSESAHPHTTSFDLTMMAFAAGQERTESEFSALLQSAGYRIVRIWRSPLSAQAIVQAELA